ncbi:MAG: hypothetical protein CM15mP21_0050 [Hyphomicrobiales bacterium]|nr:MAG: hypothetical protein CM15mP21_0050 [Hyphomicrobiales bacterium]
MCMTSPLPGPNTRCALNWTQGQNPVALYSHSRRLEALISRAVFYDLVALGETVETSSGCGAKMFFSRLRPPQMLKAWLEDDA